MRREDREGWAISTTCAILYRFIPVYKVRYWKRKRKRKRKRRKERKGKARANSRGKKERKKGKIRQG